MELYTQDTKDIQCLNHVPLWMFSLTPTIPGNAATLAICFMPGRKPPTPVRTEGTKRGRGRGGGERGRGRGGGKKPREFTQTQRMNRFMAVSCH